MLELKVQCDCGQKYKFDIEPVNNRMPFTVNCPICGLDGTEKANARLQELAASQAIPSAPVSSLPPAPAPMDPAILAAAGVAEQPRLRIHIPTSHAAPSEAPVESARRVSPVDAAIAATGGRPLSRPGAPATWSAPTASTKTPDAVNIPMGILGAVIGGFLGMLGWYFLIKATHYQIGYAAWGVGLLAGFGARILGRGGDATLGVVAGICALVGILGGQYLMAADLVNSFTSQLSGLVEQSGATVYETRMKHAKEAAKAQTDEEIKAVYEKINEAPPTESELKEFKEKELPELRDLDSGKITKDQFLKKLKEETENPMEKLTFKARWEVFKSSVDGFTLLFIFLGVSSAYKIGAG